MTNDDWSFTELPDGTWQATHPQHRQVWTAPTREALELAVVGICQLTNAVDEMCKTHATEMLKCTTEHLASARRTLYALQEARRLQFANLWLFFAALFAFAALLFPAVRPLTWIAQFAIVGALGFDVVVSRLSRRAAAAEVGRDD